MNGTNLGYYDYIGIIASTWPLIGGAAFLPQGHEILYFYGSNFLSSLLEFLCVLLVDSCRRESCHLKLNIETKYSINMYIYTEGPH